MAKVSISFSDASPVEARAVTWALAKANEAREAAGKQPYANVKEMIEGLLANEVLPSWIREQAEEQQEVDDVKQLWRDATDEQRAAALAALRG